MNILKLFVFLFITFVCAIHSENLPIYRLIDMGLFEMDGSCACAINENNQVLGKFSENENKYIFLSGMKLMVLKLLSHQKISIFMG